MRVLFSGDLPVGVTDGDVGGGVDLPSALRGVPVDRLRLFEGVVIDAGGRTSWFVDEVGRKHIEALDPAWQSVPCSFDASLRRVEGAWVLVEAAEIARAALRARASAARWARETSGVTVGGAHIPTDQRTQMVLAGAFARAVADESYAIPNWKLPDGSYVSLSNPEIRAIATSVADHIQGCFDLNAEVDAAIEAGEITTAAEVVAAFA